MNQRGGAKMPNIVVVMVDQLRANVLRAYGGQICQTPVLSGLAEQSTVFDRAYTPLSVCSPARASFLTGEYPHTHGVLTNKNQLTPGGVLADSPLLLSRQLERVGYVNWYVGKWHLGGADNLPQDLGLPGQQFAGHGEGGYDFAQYRAYLAEEGLTLSLEDGPHTFGWHTCGTLAGPEATEVSAFLTNNAISFLDRWRESPRAPFFLWVNYWGPHAPYLPTDDYLAKYDGVDIPPWPNFPDCSDQRPRIHDLKIPPASRTEGWPFWQDAVKHYFAFMSLIDHQIGRLLDHLTAVGADNDTVVIFTADHGESLGAHSLQDKGHSMYEETLRIPLMIRCPGFAPHRESRLVSLIDLYPTLMELAEGEEWQGARPEGRSLLNLLRGTKLLHDEMPWRETLVAEFHGLVMPHTQRMIVNNRHKYVWNAGDLDELYDLQDDPFEVNNLIHQPSGQVPLDLLQTALLTWMRTSKDTTLPYFERHVQNGGATRPAVI